ncbi:MAG: C45 family peptidase [Candidatus Ozemobacteraceae bacterium]
MEHDFRVHPSRSQGFAAFLFPLSKAQGNFPWPSVAGKQLRVLRTVCVGLLVGAFCLCPFSGQALHSSPSESPSTEVFIRRLGDLVRPLLEDVPVFRFEMRATVRPQAGSNEPRMDAAPTEKQRAVLTLFRNGSEEWGIRLLSSWRNVAIHRTATMSAIILPDARVRFTGRGELVEPTDTLAPKGFVGRFVTQETALSGFLAISGSNSLPAALRLFITPRLTTLPARPENPGECFFQFGDHLKIALTATGTPGIRLETTYGLRGLGNFTDFEITLEPDVGEVLPASWSDPLIVEKEVPRGDLETMIFRGFKRILSIKMPGTYVVLEPKKVNHGELRHNQGQTLVLLSGTPEQIGTAHGLLLRPWNRLLVDSTIYLVGLVETISRGKWFIGELEGAWQRLSPNIPADLHREMAALASACPDISLREVQLSNIFPEYFHCSGFALFSRATGNGVLYHGRVLDYMTEIGLQNSAVAFVIRPLNKRAFFNPGFAGFVGSVGGMNEKQISIGEMGGGGRYQWDGIPMSILVRRALEECDTLDQVKDLWKKGPRTCEYYYVFADGKIPDAVSVKATSATIEFLAPGQAHPLLGEGIADAVVMSSGQRLQNLRKRVQEGYGTFNASSALRLMDRPVAMRSNLHNILFVPQLQEVYVAIATPFEPAADQPYVRYDLKEILATIP